MPLPGREGLELIAAMPEGRGWSEPEFESLGERYHEYMAQPEDFHERVRFLGLESESTVSTELAHSERRQAEILMRVAASSRQSGRGQQEGRIRGDDGDGRE